MPKLCAIINSGKLILIFADSLHETSVCIVDSPLISVAQISQAAVSLQPVRKWQNGLSKHVCPYSICRVFIMYIYKEAESVYRDIIRKKLQNSNYTNSQGSVQYCKYPNLWENCNTRACALLLKGTKYISFLNFYDITDIMRHNSIKKFYK